MPGISANEHRGWNEQRVFVEAGNITFVQLFVRLTDRPQPGGRDLDIAGRQSGTASENVYLQIQPEHDAIQRLRETTRAAPR